MDLCLALELSKAYSHSSAPYWHGKKVSNRPLSATAANVSALIFTAGRAELAIMEGTKKKISEKCSCLKFQEHLNIFFLKVLQIHQICMRYRSSVSVSGRLQVGTVRKMPENSNSRGSYSVDGDK